MATRIVETSDAAQTEALGAELAAALKPGDIVLVRGELGAGKTTLVRGAARALGVSDAVTSPTFSIGHRYSGSQVTVSHLDLYRLSGLSAEEPELLDDYLGPGRIAFVEWPEESSVELRDARVLVTLAHEGGDRRRIELCVRNWHHPEPSPVESSRLGRESGGSGHESSGLGRESSGSGREPSGSGQDSSGSGQASAVKAMP